MEKPNNVIYVDFKTKKTLESPIVGEIKESFSQYISRIQKEEIAKKTPEEVYQEVLFYLKKASIPGNEKYITSLALSIPKEIKKESNLAILLKKLNRILLLRPKGASNKASLFRELYNDFKDI